MRRTPPSSAALAALRALPRALPLAIPLTLLPLGVSCAPAAVVGTAIIVNDEFADKAQSVVVNYPVEYVWASAKSSLSHMTDDLLDVDPDLRTIKTYVDGAEVLVQIQTFDVGQTRIRVAARRYLVFSDEVAVNVRDGIERDLG